VMLSVHCGTMLAHAANLKGFLQDRGYTVFLCNQIQPGAHFRNIISSYAASCKIFIAFMNGAWCNSRECDYEFNIALNTKHIRGKPYIIPLLLEDIPFYIQYPSAWGLLCSTNGLPLKHTDLNNHTWQKIENVVRQLAAPTAAPTVAPTTVPIIVPIIVPTTVPTTAPAVATITTTATANATTSPIAATTAATTVGLKYCGSYLTVTPATSYKDLYASLRTINHKPFTGDPVEIVLIKGHHTAISKKFTLSPSSEEKVPTHSLDDSLYLVGVRLDLTCDEDI